ncbi:hypothetical protein ACFL0Z_02500 [Patescibacteria group bacterium]
MDLTTEVLSKYVGGQLEIQNKIEEYLFRGEIANASVTDGEDKELKIQFRWIAKGDGYPPLPTKWVNHEDTNYAVSLMTANHTDQGNGRLVVQTGFVSNELLVFLPPSGSKLDPKKVEGLQL